jgi:hypothetical protein
MPDTSRMKRQNILGLSSTDCSRMDYSRNAVSGIHGQRTARDVRVASRRVSVLRKVKSGCGRK